MSACQRLNFERPFKKFIYFLLLKLKVDDKQSKRMAAEALKLPKITSRNSCREIQTACFFFTLPGELFWARWRNQGWDKVHFNYINLLLIMIIKTVFFKIKNVWRNWNWVLIFFPIPVTSDYCWRIKKTLQIFLLNIHRSSNGHKNNETIKGYFSIIINDYGRLW